MMLSHHQKYRRVVQYEHTRHGGSLTFARKKARARLGIGNVYESKLFNDPNMTLGVHAPMLDAYYHEIYPEVGDADYQRLRCEVYRIMEGIQSRRATERADSVRFFDNWLLTCAVQWARIAADAADTDERRLLFGRMGEFVLYHYVCHYSDVAKHLRHTLVSSDEAKALGMSAIQGVNEVLNKYSDEPPPALFSCEGPYSAARGFAMFRVRMRGDLIGWEMLDASDDARIHALSRAYESGLVEDYLRLRKYDREEISYLSHPWVMLVHAGQFGRSVEVASDLFAAFPKYFEGEIRELKPILEDVTVWPGLAAILLCKGPEFEPLRNAVNQRLDERSEFSKAMALMAAAVDAGRSYKEVLKLLGRS
jgi:hypothetical protein